jgi:hypothetical protein
LYDQDSSDFHNYSGVLRLDRNLDRNYGLFAEYQQIYRTYDEDGISQENVGDNDYLVYAPGAGFFYDWDQDMSFSFGIGYYYQQIEDDDDESGGYFIGNITKLWQYQRSTLQAIGSSGLDSSDFTSERLGFQRFAQIELNATHEFTRRFFGQAGGYFRFSDYINSDDDRKDYRFRGSAGLGYVVTQWMTVNLDYQYNKLVAENSLSDFEVNQVFLSINLQADRPWRF